MALTDRRPSVLITGAAGGLGRLLLPVLSRAYSVSLLDRRPRSPSPVLLYHPIDLSETTDLDACLSGVETVIHLAGEPTADLPWEELFAANVLATQNVFRAAHRVGCRRVILASSVQVMDGYPRGMEITPDMPVWPINPYAVSKACAEAVAARFARKSVVSVICLRLGWVLPIYDWRITPWSPYLDRILTEGDFLRAMKSALQYPGGDPFEIHHVLSDNRVKRLNIDSARSRIGYCPRDDAYALARWNVPGMARSAVILLRRRLRPPGRFV
jgi:NAD(P)-dependent dehydrogenase (short-subunit alcohol dehydrogenase family)